MRQLVLGLTIAIAAGACGGDGRTDDPEPLNASPDTVSNDSPVPGNGSPESELFGAAAEALVTELVQGDTVWFYETPAMTPEAREAIKSALGGFTVLFGDDWSDITSCVPAGPRPVTLSLGSASVDGDSAEIPVSIDDPYAANDATVRLALIDTDWQVTDIEYGPHGDKFSEDC